MYPQVTFPVVPLLKRAAFFKLLNTNELTSSQSILVEDSASSITTDSLFTNPSNQPSLLDSNSSSMPVPSSDCSSNCSNSLKSICSNSIVSRVIIAALLLLSMLLFSPKVKAQGSYGTLQKLKVNPLITTVITATEPIEIVDLSTDSVIGEKTLDNTLMIKPVNNDFVDGDFIATLTIITERYRVQYGLVYTEDLSQAVTDKQLFVQEMTSFKNPEILMSKEEMRQYASRIWSASSHIRNISSSQHKMKIRLNNIYSVGGYFFLDFSIENKTNIQFDIDEIRLKLSDKKIAKATNNQMIEMRPEIVLYPNNKLKKSYRNVIVIPKLTFPNDKVLTLEISEKQISGRTLKLNIDYEDILNADAFSEDLMQRR